MSNILTGALLDQRLEEDKAKDWLHEELSSGDEAYQWEETPIRDRYYFPYDQSISLSCVAGGIAITEEHFNKGAMIPSRKDVYIRRANRPGGGMMMHDAFSIAIKGIASENLVKSQGLSETPMNAQYEITNEIARERSSHAFEAWVSVKNFKDIDSIAKIVKHTPVVSFWFFDAANDHYEWWTNQPRVVTQNLDLYGANTIRHQVCIVDAVLVDGKKFLVIQDTADLGSGLGADKNLRLISQEMLSARCYSAGYGIDKPEAIVPPKPRFRFTRALQVGMSGDDVRALQEILKYEGCITLNASTRYFGGITLAGVKKLQEKHKAEILTPAGLKRPTGYVGSNTLKYLNKNYE